MENEQSKTITIQGRLALDFLEGLGIELQKFANCNTAHLDTYLEVATRALQGSEYQVWMSDNSTWVCVVGETVGRKAPSKLAAILAKVSRGGKALTTDSRLFKYGAGNHTPDEYACLIPFCGQNSTAPMYRHVAVVQGKHACGDDTLGRHDLGQITQAISNLLSLAANHIHSVYEQWQQAFHRGSRNGILEWSRRLSDIGRCFLPPGLSDFVNAYGADNALCLSIVPSRTKTGEMAIASNPTAINGVLSRLVNARWAIWIEYEKTKAIKYKSIRDVAALYSATNTNLFNPNHFPGILDATEACLVGMKSRKTNLSCPDQLKMTVLTFSSVNVVLNERLRTILFSIYHASVWQEEIATSDSISALDELMRTHGESIRDELKDLLLAFMDSWQKGVTNKTLPITADWSIIWFGVRMLEMETWPGISCDSTPCERAVNYKHYAAYYLFCLHIVRWCGDSNRVRFSDIQGGDETFIESMLFNLSQYGHRRLGIARQIPLYDVLLEIWLAEAVLYTVRDSYRDHLHHVINVYLIGLLLFDAGLVDTIRDLRSPLTIEETIEWERNWFVAALFHDVGYIAALGEDLVKRMAFLGRAPILKNFSLRLKEGVATATKGFVVDYEKLPGSIWLPGDHVDHGQASSAFIRSLCDNGQEDTTGSVDLKWIESVKTALHAVESHNLPNRHVMIQPKEYPMSFLLILCDHLQEWDRPRFDPIKIRRAVSTMIHWEGNNSPKGQQLIRWLETDLIWSAGKARMRQPRRKARFAMVYADASKEKFEPAVIWAMNTIDLQAIDCTEWPKGFSLELTSAHSLSEELCKEGGMSEFDLISDYIRLTPSSAMLIPWLEHARRNNSWFKHNIEKGVSPVTETFTWIFEKRSFDRPIRKKCPRGFFSSFFEWKSQRIRQTRLHRVEVEHVKGES